MLGITALVEHLATKPLARPWRWRSRARGGRHPPFRIYYQRAEDAFVVVRVYHQRRESITSGGRRD